jgi:hypothetical protein
MKTSALDGRLDRRGFNSIRVKRGHYSWTSIWRNCTRLRGVL